MRFHKSLELEEDEVKTLICRYPPPLAHTAAPAQPDGFSLSHAHRPPLDAEVITATGQRAREREPTFDTRREPTNTLLSKTLANTQLEQLDDERERERDEPQQQQQHNVVDNSHQHNDNLLLAPTVGDQQQHNANLVLASRPTSPLPDASVFGAPAERPPALSTRPLLAATSSYFDRLSSIELLLLISLLMFLLLLALGLASGYYFVGARRRRRQRAAFTESSSGRGDKADAILKRKRRFVSPGVAGMSPAALAQAHYEQQQAAASLRQHHMQQLLAQQQQQQQHLQRSSPDSDELSTNGHGLLISNRASASLASTLGRRGASQFEPSATSGAFVNRAFVDSRELAAGRRGQRHASSAIGGRRGLAEPQYSESTVASRRQRGAPQPQHRYLLGQGEFEQPLMAGAARAHYAQVNKRQQRDNFGSGLYRASQVYVADDLRYDDDDDDAPPPQESGANVTRAKSMSAPRWPAAGGSMARKAKVQASEQAHRYASSTIGRLNASRRAQIGAHFAAHAYRPQQDSPRTVSQQASDEAAHGDKQQQQQPKLVLKSIEDAFITNYTEIREQEYMERDNRRPFSLAEWRAVLARSSATPKSAAPNVAAADTNNNNEERATSKHFSADVCEQTQDDDDDDEDLLPAQLDRRKSSTQTNLRSLTELDVNFAKSLLAPVLAQQQQQLKTEPPDAALRHTASDSKLDERTPNEPHADKQSKSDSGAPAIAQQHSDSTHNKQPSSPDLIISPDYVDQTDSNTRLRLHVGTPDNAVSPHDSVSYV